MFSWRTNPFLTTGKVLIIFISSWWNSCIAWYNRSKQNVEFVKEWVAKSRPSYFFISSIFTLSIPDQVKMSKTFCNGNVSSLVCTILWSRQIICWYRGKKNNCGTRGDLATWVLSASSSINIYGGYRQILIFLKDFSQIILSQTLAKWEKPPK